MQIQVDIKPKEKLEKHNSKYISLPDLEAFLMSAPTFSAEQLKTIKQARNAINGWRKNSLH